MKTWHSKQNFKFVPIPHFEPFKKTSIFYIKNINIIQIIVYAF